MSCVSDHDSLSLEETKDDPGHLLTSESPIDKFNLDDYEKMGELGQGGQAIVYKVRHRRTG
jgi:hypothetical protein